MGEAAVRGWRAYDVSRWPRLERATHLEGLREACGAGQHSPRVVTGRRDARWVGGGLGRWPGKDVTKEITGQSAEAVRQMEGIEGDAYFNGIPTAAQSEARQVDALATFANKDGGWGISDFMGKVRDKKV